MSVIQDFSLFYLCFPVDALGPNTENIKGFLFLLQVCNKCYLSACVDNISLLNVIQKLEIHGVSTLFLL